MKAKIDTVIADFDRTLAYLYRDESLLTELARKICDLYSGYLHVNSAYRNADGYIAWYALHAEAKEGLPESKAYELNLAAEAEVTQFEKQVVARTDLFEGVENAVRSLFGRGVGLFVVSNNAGQAVCQALEKAGIDNMFCGVAGRPFPFDTAKLKPSPYMLDELVGKYALDRHTCIYVGDDITDMQAACSAGILPVGVTTGRHDAEKLRKHGAFAVLGSFSDVPDFIEEQSAAQNIIKPRITKK